MFQFKRRSLLVAAWLLLALFSSSALAEEWLDIVIGGGNITSGNKQSYDEGHGQRIIQGQKPDIFLINEFNIGDNSETTVRNWVDETFGEGFHYFRENEPGDQIPNGIISRWPIIKKGEIREPGKDYNRGIVWAIIELPGGYKMLAISAHLPHGDVPRREEQARLIDKFVDHLFEDGTLKRGEIIVPGGKRVGGDFAISGVDFNTKSRNEATLQILGNNFSDKHVPVDPTGDSNTSGASSHPYDYVLFSYGLDVFQVCLDRFSRLGQQRKDGVNAFPNGLVVRTDRFPDPRVIAPARPNDSLAQNMQHNALFQQVRIPIDAKARAEAQQLLTSYQPAPRKSPPPPKPGHVDGRKKRRNRNRN